MNADEQPPFALAALDLASEMCWSFDNRISHGSADDPPPPPSSQRAHSERSSR